MFSTSSVIHNNIHIGTDISQIRTHNILEKIVDVNLVAIFSDTNMMLTTIDSLSYLSIRLLKVIVVI